jgi:amino acid transporter
MNRKSKPYKKIGIISLAAIIFFTISGGPYGLESILFYCGGKGAMLLLIVVPFLWDIPIVLAVLELNSLMPETGGYYQWVKKALGLRWAFYEGWWSWLCIFVDLAIYPQLVILYASLFFPEIATFKIPVCLFIIWGCAYLNIRGIVSVGKISKWLGVLIIVPFVLLVMYGLFKYPINFDFSVVLYKNRSTYLGMAIFTIIWNFIGWDNVTTYANEVNRPVTSYLKAICSAFAFIFILYYSVMLVAQNSGISLVEFKDKGFPSLGLLVAGKWMAIIIAVGGILSSIGLFLAVLLSISRVPEVMAIDKLLPAQLYKLHAKYNTPYISIIVCACIVSFMVVWTFGELLIIDVTVYFVGLTLEFLSLIILRMKRPDDVRPFRIPLNIAGLCVMLSLPIIVYFIALGDIIIKSNDSFKPILFSILMLLSADVAWRVIVFTKRRKSS